jgi:DNA-binding LacI/PurR family transcriptional regulator
MIPPLTTVHRFTEETGDSAAEAMIDLIERRTPQARTSAPMLAIRESTRPLRG